MPLRLVPNHRTQCRQIHRGDAWRKGQGDRAGQGQGVRCVRCSHRGTRMPPVAKVVVAALALAASVSGMAVAAAAEIKVVSGGAFKQVLSALAAQYEKESGNKIDVIYQTVGQHLALIRSGREDFDVAVLTPDAIDSLANDGKIVAGSRADLAKTGVGVAVKASAPVPDISTVDAFKQALLKAKSVAYIDPKSGGSSGIYVEKLLERLGIADQIQPKTKLKQGGAVAELVASGEAELGVHQISEILPVKGVTLVGPLPKEIQNLTTYAAGLSSAPKQPEAAKAFIKALSGPQAAAVLKSKGM